MKNRNYFIFVSIFYFYWKVEAKTHYFLQPANYAPQLFVASAISEKDFKDQLQYTKWIASVSNFVTSELKRQGLNLKVVFKEKALFIDIFQASRDVNNVGLILISHGSPSNKLYNGLIKDYVGNNLQTALLNSNPNLRSVALAGCYTSDTMQFLAHQESFGPYTHRVSYDKKNYDVFVIPDAIRSVAQHLKRTNSTWENSIIRKNSLKKFLTFRRKLSCSSNPITSVTLKLGPYNLGLFPAATQCGVEQVQTFGVPIEILSKKENRLLVVEGLQSNLSGDSELGLLEIDKPSILSRRVDTAGNPLGRRLHVYDFTVQ